MLIYHPAFDINHCIFRILRILQKLPAGDYEIEKIRILDFYLLFPDEISEFKFPRSSSSYRKQLPKPNRYEKIEDPKRILMRLESFQLSALKCLAAYGFIDATLLEQGKIRRSPIQIPVPLSDAVEKANGADPFTINLLTGPFGGIDLCGKTGLKMRSDLFEYRYDL